MPVVSVIIAAYNAESSLRRCLESISAQTLTDFEVIIIDDGSTDKTGQIADAFARADCRNRVIHQQNKGVAAARQIGLDSATGIYTIHVDADDWIEPTMLAELVSSARTDGSDMVICDYFEHRNNGMIIREQRPSSLDSRTVLGEMMYNLYGCVWNKLIKRDCFLKYNVRFDEKLTCCEDQLLILRLLSHNLRISYLHKAFYHYDLTQNAASFTNKGISASQRLLPLELISQETDLDDVRSYYDKAICLIAHEYIATPNSPDFDFSKTFYPYLKPVLRATAIPFHSRLLVILRIFHIKIPVDIIMRRKHCN